VTIEETDIVDAIGVESRSGKVILTIFDHLDWRDEKAHLVALENKVNTYLRFIESGELREAYPDAKKRNPVIDLVTRLELPKAGIDYLARIRRVLGDAGIGLRTRVQAE
jgi:uncharacterized protein DUF6572